MHISSRKQLADMIATSETSGYTHQIPLLRAVRAGRINMLMLDRAAILPKLTLRKSTRPVIVLIGDDDRASTGPAGWRCAKTAIEWATGAVVHGCGGKAEHYEGAVRYAEVIQRLLFVETTSAWADGWISATRRAGCPTLAHLPRSGTPAREAVH